MIKYNLKFIIDDNYENCEEESIIFVNTIELINYLYKKGLFEYGGKYIKYFFPYEYMFINTIDKLCFNDVYLSYKTLCYYEGYEIKRVLIGFGSQFGHTDIFSKLKISDIYNDPDLLFISRLYSTDSSSVDLVIDELAYRKLIYYNFIIYECGTIKTCFNKIDNLTRYNFISNFVKASIDYIYYLFNSNTLILQYKLNDQKFYKL